jgi:hypothetical protein
MGLQNYEPLNMPSFDQETMLKKPFGAKAPNGLSNDTRTIPPGAE